MFKLIQAELLRYKIELKHYYVDQIVSLFVQYLLFLAFFRGASYSSSYIIGYLYWIFASEIISEMSEAMSEEKQMGTLQHIMLMPNDLYSILIVRTYAVFLFSLVKGAFLLLLISITLPMIVIEVNIFMLIVLGVSVVGFTGIGLLLSGLTMKFAKVASFESIFSYSLLLISGTAIPFDALPNIVQACVPYTPYTYAIQVSQISVSASIPWGSLITLSIMNTICFIVGLIIFKVFVEDAKLRGIANNY